METAQETSTGSRINSEEAARESFAKMKNMPTSTSASTSTPTLLDSPPLRVSENNFAIQSMNPVANKSGLDQSDNTETTVQFGVQKEGQVSPVSEVHLHKGLSEGNSLEEIVLPEEDELITLEDLLEVFPRRPSTDWFPIITR